MTETTNTTVASLASVVANGAASEVIERLATRANADRVVALARKRIEKAREAIAADEAFIAGVANFRDSLPEGVASAPTISASVGDTVVIRRKSKADGSKEVEGVVAAFKAAEGDKLAQFRVQVGEGFDAEYVNVFPGQVVRNVTTGQGQAADAAQVANDAPASAEQDAAAALGLV